MNRSKKMKYEIKQILEYTLNKNLKRLENKEPPYQEKIIQAYLDDFEAYVTSSAKASQNKQR